MDVESPADWDEARAALEACPGVQWSACVRGPEGVPLLDHHASTALSTASIGKLFLLLEVARRLESGEWPDDLALSRHAGVAVADSGLWQHLTIDALPVEDLAVLVAAVSDNLATNVLLEAVGLDAVAAWPRALGFTASALHDRVRDERTAADPPRLSTGSAAELSQLFVALHARSGPVAEVADRVLAWLATDTDTSMVAAVFGLDPLAHMSADRGLQLWHKTGTNDGVRADAGCLVGPAGFRSYAVIANWDTAVDRRDEVLAAMRTVGEHLRTDLTGRAMG